MGPLLIGAGIVIAFLGSILIYKWLDEGSPTPSPEMVKLMNAHQKIGSAIIDQFKLETKAAKKNLVRTYSPDYFASIDKYSRKDKLNEEFQEFLEWRKRNR